MKLCLRDGDCYEREIPEEVGVWASSGILFI